jgi:hypothetical protein
MDADCRHWHRAVVETIDGLIRQDPSLGAELFQGEVVEPLVVRAGWHGSVPDDLLVFLRGNFRSVSRRSFHGDTGCEYAAEVNNAEENDQQQRQNQRKFDERLPSR